MFRYTDYLPKPTGDPKGDAAIYSDYMRAYKPESYENPYGTFTSEGYDWGRQRASDYRGQIQENSDRFMRDSADANFAAREEAMQAEMQRQQDQQAEISQRGFSEWLQEQSVGYQGSTVGEWPQQGKRSLEATAKSRDQWQKQYEMLLSQGYKPWEAKSRVADLMNKAPDQVPEAVRNSVNPEWVKQQQAADAKQRTGWGVDDAEQGAWARFVQESQGKAYNPDEAPDLATRQLPAEIQKAIQGHVAAKTKGWGERFGALTQEGYNPSGAIEAIYDMDRWGPTQARPDVQEALQSAETRKATLGSMGQKRKYTDQDWMQIVSKINEMKAKSDQGGPVLPETVRQIATNPMAATQLRQQIASGGVTGLPDELIQLLSPLDAESLLSARKPAAPKTYAGYSAGVPQDVKPGSGVSTSPGALESEMGPVNEGAKNRVDQRQKYRDSQRYETFLQNWNTWPYLQTAAITGLMKTLSSPNTKTKRPSSGLTLGPYGSVPKHLPPGAEDFAKYIPDRKTLERLFEAYGLL